jgi:hypothetical protein
MIYAATIRWDLPPSEPDDARLADATDLAVEALIEAQSYRLVAQQLLHQLHQAQLERDILRGQLRIDRSRAREEEAA